MESHIRDSPSDFMEDEADEEDFWIRRFLLGVMYNDRLKSVHQWPNSHQIGAAGAARRARHPSIHKAFYDMQRGMDWLNWRLDCTRLLPNGKIKYRQPSRLIRSRLRSYPPSYCVNFMTPALWQVPRQPRRSRRAEAEAQIKPPSLFLAVVP